MYDLQSNILSKTGYNAAQLRGAANAIRPDEAFEDAIEAIVAAENKQGINALFSLAHAAIESAWGTSYYASARNNLFGFNAYDSDPNQASSYPSKTASVEFYANFLKNYYLTPGGAYFNGTTPHGVFVKYSSSHDSEAQHVVDLMNQLESHITGEPVSPPATPPFSTPVLDHEYEVVHGDTLWAIAQANSTTVDQIISANKLRYPSIGTGIDAHLEAGWRIFVPNAETVIRPAVESVNIAVPAGPNGYLGNLAKAYGTTVEQLIEWNKDKYPAIGTTFQNIPSYIRAGWNIRVK